MIVAPIEDRIIDALNPTESQVRRMKLTAVIDLFVFRLEAARARGATDPLRVGYDKHAVEGRNGGNSRNGTGPRLC
jgi:hypothetical protein